ncbi:hypothetical protein LSUE1_G000519 [Lachnellula suecica]|uniref:Chitin-binding type-4 domain-containing protein n=1 Tax=Lachnellula suecica TaxID=602035 RepID=A0A8T9CHL0_9HELO|nr:hypothetical protein LSUE1_G000519 [Lachnellula suecica]
MHFLSNLVAIAALATTALSHGIITSPYPRAIGAASLAACGPTVQANIKGDNTSHVEGLPEAAATDKAYNATACNLWLCRGLQGADNAAHVQNYTAGQKVSIAVNLRIKHYGTANVSIVDTKSNSVVGKQLYYWSDYADERVSVTPANQTNFDIVIPDLGGKCATAGACVIQWWWYGVGAKQTYESCIDFTQPATPVTAGKSWKPRGSLPSLWEGAMM